MIEDRPQLLKLVGYAPLSDDGFALPCYGVAPRPNQWWLARSLIPGDHQSSIAAFELFEASDVTHIPPRELLEAGVGSPWLDVFVYEGEAFAGTPQDILRVLADRFDTLVATAPFDALALAMAAGHARTSELVRAARTGVAELYGDDRAERWLTQLVIRPQARMELRRRLHRAGLTDDQNRVQQVTVEASGEGYALSAPPQLVEAFLRAGKGEALTEAATAVGSALAVSIGALRVRSGDTVERVEVRGAVRTGAELIVAASGLSAGDPINPDLLEQALARVRAMERFEKVGGVVVRGVVRIEVEEAALVSVIRIEGARRLRSQAVLKATELKPNTVIRAWALDEALERVQQFYLAHGIRASGMAEAVPIRDRIELIIRVEEFEDAESTVSDDILVVYRGEDAARVARLLSRLDWSPLPDRAFVPDTSRAVRFSMPKKETSRIRVSAAIPRDGLRRFGVVVFLVDDDAAVADLLLGQAFQQRDLLSQQQVLIAPVPPAGRPAELLADRLLVNAPLNAVLLDTSLARSPFWPIDRRGSEARQVADCIMGAAMILASGAEPLMRRADDRAQLPVLAWCEDARRGRIALASESFPERLAGSNEVDEVNFDFEAYSDDEYFGSRPGRGIVSLAASVPYRFEDLVENVFQLAKGLTIPMLPSQRSRAKVEHLAEGLTAPHLAVMLDEGDGVIAASGRAMITAEAPSLRVLMRAERDGVSVARYTDLVALRALEHRSETPILPTEIQLPSLRRLVPAGAWISRGLDTPHQARRMSRETFESLRAAHYTPFAEQVRLLRETLDPLEPSQVVALNLDIDAADGHDRLANAFLDLGVPPRSRPPSYGAHRAWRARPGGLRRFVVPTTAASVSVADLPDNQVPGRSLLFLDGDMAVPTLLASRVFSLWVRVNSTSLGGRYRISAETLETFPIPSNMDFVDVGAGSLALVLKEPFSIPFYEDREMVWFGPTIQIYEKASNLSIHDDLVLAGYNLPPDATDLQILDRLLAFSSAWP